MAEVSDRTRSSSEHHRSIRTRPKLDSYLAFLQSQDISFESVIRPTIGAYVRSITDVPVPRARKKGLQARTTLAHATLQQHLTVVRLFHDFLVEERICTRNPLRPAVAGRSFIQRQYRLPWIPNEEEWRTILHVSKQEPLRNRVMSSGWSWYSSIVTTPKLPPPPRIAQK